MKTLGAAAIAVMALTVAAEAATLTGTLRRFENHPNFGQGQPFNPQAQLTGIVSPTLTGSAPTPVFTEGSRTDAPLNFTTHADFNEWWTDGTDVQDFDITFVDVGGTLTYNGAQATPGTQFFPYGNNQYLFTFQVSGLLSFEADDFFNVTSDDDVWVFVNNTLFLEMAGVRPPITGGFTAANLIAAGLMANTNYKFDIFFAERNVELSQLTVSTDMSIAPVPLPAPIALLAAGMAGLGALRLRRKAA